MAKKRNWTQTISIYVGIGLAILMGASLIAPALQPTTTVQEAPTIEPTNTPEPEYPDPITDFSTISFEQGKYLHPSGLFTVSVPTGWQPSQPFNNGRQAQSNFNNADQLSVIEVYLQDPAGQEINTLEDLSGLFTFASLSNSWARYTNWEELSRELDEENNRVVIDFRLSRGAEQFFAQHAAWYDDEYVYVVRAVTPENNPELLFFLIENMIPTVEALPQFSGSPLGWSAYFDDAENHIVRFPSNWQITDTGQGLPTSIEGEDIAMRVELGDDQISDEDAARAYVEGLRSDIEVVSVEPVERNGGEGFAVAYSYSTPDGSPVSGQVVLLNGEDDLLHIANGFINGVDLDLNADDIPTEAQGLTGALDTFSLITGVDFYEPPPPPVTPTPQPVEESTPEATPEATDAAESTPEATLEATEEADEDEDSEETPEPEATEEE